MSQRTTRRNFVQLTAAAAVGAPLASTVFSKSVTANSKLNHACIGVGGMGAHDLGQYLGHRQTQVVAICDVDEQRLEAAYKTAKSRGNNPRKYTDWRELLDKEGDKIDSCNATVPDHMHAAVSMTAMSKGKHVYCQKPLCHDVAEARAIAEASKKFGVNTQLGTQGAASFGNRLAVYHLQNGDLGKIKRVVLCSNRPGAIKTYRLEGPRPAKGQAAPKHLHWDNWIGTAPYRDFSPGIYHPTVWRAWQDFGTGWSGDIGCHVLDAVWKGLGLTAPKSIHARVQESWQNDAARRADVYPQSDHITWVFPGNKLTDGDLTMEWFDGLFYPPKDVQALCELGSYPAESAMIIGEEGSMIVPNGRPEAHMFPAAKFKGIKRPKLAPRNHYHHFLDGCLGKAKNESYFEVSGPMTETVLLGTVAIRTPGQTLQWDAKKMQITNNADAQKLIKRTYRKGWEVDGLS